MRLTDRRTASWFIAPVRARTAGEISHSHETPDRHGFLSCPTPTLRANGQSPPREGDVELRRPSSRLQDPAFASATVAPSLRVASPACGAFLHVSRPTPGSRPIGTAQEEITARVVQADAPRSPAAPSMARTTAEGLGARSRYLLATGSEQLRHVG